MAQVVSVTKVNPPVDGGLREERLAFLISLLDRQDKVEFVRAFEDDFWTLVQEGRLSKVAVYKFLSGQAPSDERVIEVAEMDKAARDWIVRRVKAKATRALEIVRQLEGEEE